MHMYIIYGEESFDYITRYAVNETIIFNGELALISFRS